MWIGNKIGMLIKFGLSNPELIICCPYHCISYLTYIIISILKYFHSKNYLSYSYYIIDTH